MSCEDQFTVIKGKGRTLLSKGTAEKLNVLRVGPVRPGIRVRFSQSVQLGTYDI